MDAVERIERLKSLGSLLTETLKRGEEKVALAKTTFDAVSFFFFHLKKILAAKREEHIQGGASLQPTGCGSGKV